MKTVISTEHITKVFGEEKDNKTCVLAGIDLKINEGEFVSIMGQSGSGKSTLLYSVSGMDQISSGKVLFGDKDISNLKADHMSRLRLEEMGFIFQHAYFLSDLTIEDNIMLPAMKAGKMKKQEVIARKDALMQKMEISHVARHSTSQVSGGQLQRASICRALMNQPKVLFADEPTGALNRSTTKEVMNLLNQISAEGTTIVLVTHDAKVAARADRIVYLADGKIEAECMVGRFKDEDKERRENLVSSWLVERGF